MRSKYRYWLLGAIAFFMVIISYIFYQNNFHFLQQTAQIPTNQTILESPPKAVAIAPKGLTATVRGDVRIAVISDLNSQYGSTDYEAEVDKAIALIPDWQPDLVLSGGDMVAGQKASLSKEQIEAMWAGFDQHIAAPLRKAGIPLGFTLGNHDASGAITGGKMPYQKERELAANYWQNPAHNPGLNFIDQTHFPFYYSFQQKDIFYLVWDATTDKLTPEQLAWVEQSLASPVAQNAKLRLAIGHIPLYAVAIGRNKAGEVLSNADQLRELLEKYNVHTYISGHQHAYYPGKRGKLQLLHTGALGSGARRLLNSGLSPFKTLTIVDINLAKAETIYTTYNMKTMQVVDSQILPRLITSVNRGWVLRRDLEVSDLTAQECQQISGGC